MNSVASAASSGRSQKWRARRYSAQNGRQRRQQERQVQSHFGPAENSRRRRKVVGGQRRILHHAPHWLPSPVPVYIEAVWIERMRVDLPRRPDKERIIHIKRFSQEGSQKEDHRQSQRPSGMRCGPFQDFIPSIPANRRSRKIHPRVLS